MTVDKFTAPITKGGLSAPRRVTREGTTIVVSLNKADARIFIRKLQGAVIKLDDGSVMTLTTNYEQYRMNGEEVLQFFGKGLSAYNKFSAPLDGVRNPRPLFRYH